MLRRRIEQLQREVQGRASRAVLHDGTTLDIPHEDRLEALLCLLDDEDAVRKHPLHDVLKRLAPRHEQEDQSISAFANILEALAAEEGKEVKGGAPGR